MSVPKPERKESEAEFVMNARTLAGYTIQKCVGAIPKRYTFYYGQKLGRMALDIYDLCINANGRWPQNAGEAQERINLLLAAHGKARAMVGIIEIANESIHFESEMMKEWVGYVWEEVRLIKGVIKSDRERFFSAKAVAKGKEQETK